MHAGSARRGGALTLVATAVLLVSGCTDGGDDARAASSATPSEQRTVRLLVRDANIREVGEPCSGAGGYLYVHPTAPFAITDSGGSTVTSGTMPAGTARAALEQDLGVQRVPTFCEFSVPVSVPAGDGYALVLDEGDPIPLTAQDDEVEGKVLVGVL
ncbi:hypothetical protein [Motilibacter aurantiacus]|uniref:hypothetical protein n=1 Tax=Motilibacter aurantiacus TaxID=2714955 RepID=UPI001408ED38|nr:hypothetical protein [Motilibacter aurantiacus]NHC47511.1 hypothetical protein [Motilibacter aurantiacus]